MYNYRIYSNKRRGAYLIFRVSGAALIRGRRLFKRFIPQGRERGKFTAFTQELKNAKILKRELNERASRYTHFELLMKINSHCWLRTALQRLQCIFIILWKDSNKRRTCGAALIRVNTVISKYRRQSLCVYHLFKFFIIEIDHKHINIFFLKPKMETSFLSGLVEVSTIPFRSCDDCCYRYIDVNFTFGLLDCDRFIGDIVISKIVISGFHCTRKTTQLFHVYWKSFKWINCKLINTYLFLIFTAPPRFLGQTLPTTRQVKEENTPMSYLCVAEAKPAATIQWVLNGKNLTNSPPYNISGSFKKVKGSKLWRTFSYLDITQLTWRQYGNFSCIAHNEAGHVRQNTELEVRC